ncbi:MAG: hypothetical protein AAF352_07575 [Pseudomonadota bacterium]
MFGLVGTIIGLGSSFLPKLLDFFREQQDRKHELAIMDRQLKAQELGHTQRMEAIYAEGAANLNVEVQKSAAVSSGIRWIEGLKGSVRPMVTYLFFILYASVKIAQYRLSLETGLTSMEAVAGLWTDVDSGIFSTIIAFWFGERLYNRGKK